MDGHRQASGTAGFPLGTLGINAGQKEAWTKSDIGALAQSLPWAARRCAEGERPWPHRASLIPECLRPDTVHLPRLCLPAIST